MTGISMLAAIVLIGVFAIWKILSDRRSGLPLKDERSRKITGTAATYTFYIGSYFMIALMLANLLTQEFLDVPLLEDGYALIAAILVNSLTFLVLKWYFNREGVL